MGRLIDADSLKKELYQQWFIDILLTQTSSEDMFYALAQKIDAQPTAYDPDKVVEQLEEAEHNARTMIGFEKAYGSVDDRIKAEAEARALKHAIEIVKGGGVDAN